MAMAELDRITQQPAVVVGQACVRGTQTPCVVQPRAADIRPDVIGSRLVLHQQRHELERGALVSVDAIRNRVRLLPLPPAS
jgi:hypothetical protein